MFKDIMAAGATSLLVVEGIAEAPLVESETLNFVLKLAIPIISGAMVPFLNDIRLEFKYRLRMSRKK